MCACACRFVGDFMHIIVVTVCESSMCIPLGNSFTSNDGQSSARTSEVVGESMEWHEYMYMSHAHTHTHTHTHTHADLIC